VYAHVHVYVPRYKDALLLEVDGQRVDEVADMVRECMEGAAVLGVPLRAKIRVGPSWGQLEELENINPCENP